MKKRFALILTASMLTAAGASTALAEGPGQGMGSMPQMEGQQMPGGAPQGRTPSDSRQQGGPGGQMNMPQGQAPAAGEQAAPQGQAPAASEQAAPQGQAPAAGEQTAPQGQAPAAGGQVAPQGQAPAAGEQATPKGQAPAAGEQAAPKGQASATEEGTQVSEKAENKKTEKDHGMISFEEFVKNGTISQETYDKILAYMQEHKPDVPADAAEAKDFEDTLDEQKQERPEKAKEGKKPERPEKAINGEKLKHSEEAAKGERPDLLNDLLNDGIITQEEYDKISAARSAARPAKGPSMKELPESSKADDTQAGSTSTDNAAAGGALEDSADTNSADVDNAETDNVNTDNADTNNAETSSTAAENTVNS